MELEHDIKVCYQQLVSMKIVMSDKEYIEHLKNENKLLKEKLGK
jgi:hypothetical protein